MKNKKTPPRVKLLSLAEVAECMGFSYRAFQKHWVGLLADGLVAIKIGRQWRVRESELERFILEREQKQA